MGQKQRIELKQNQALSQLDYIDMISICEGAAGTAVKLVEKHNGDLNAIEKEILEMEIPAELVGIEGFNYRDEILWNVKYLRIFMPGLLVEGKNPIFRHFMRTLEESSHTSLPTK
ncbi:MAG: hypothetical protein AAB616_02130 [Patescibacteria group bacterium]